MRSCNCLYGASSVFNVHLAAALCRAINDWVVAEWLDKEPRLRASIVVPVQDAEFAAAEIDRCAADTRFVQVLLPAAGESPLGKRQHWPIYVAAERHGLPVCIHAGSTFRHATTKNGWPSYYLEDYVVGSHAFQAQLLSLISEGVFSKFPGPDSCAGGSRLHLAAAVHVARGEDVAGDAGGSAVGGSRAGGDHSRPCAVHAATVRCAA